MTAGPESSIAPPDRPPPAGLPRATLWERTRRHFAPPVFPDDAEKTRRAALFNICYLFCAAWLVLTLVGHLLGRQVHAAITVMLAVAIPLGLVPYLWVRRGHLDSGAKIWLAYSFVMATLGLALLGTIRAPALGFYLILVICAGLLFGRRALLAMVVLSSLAVAALIVAENRGWLPLPDYRVTITQWVTATAFFVCVGGLTQTADRQIRSALRRAEQELRERRAVEAQLREANRQLTEALQNVKTLRGLLPVCAWCHKVREDEGYWRDLESYLAVHTDSTITHSICPQCRDKYFPVPNVPEGPAPG